MLIKLAVSPHTQFSKNIKFHENLSSGSSKLFHAGWWTDGQKDGQA